MEVQCHVHRRNALSDSMAYASGVARPNSVRVNETYLLRDGISRVTTVVSHGGSHRRHAGGRLISLQNESQVEEGRRI